MKEWSFHFKDMMSNQLKHILPFCDVQSIEHKIKESIQEGSTSYYTTKASMPASAKDNGLGVVAVTHTKTGSSQSQKMQNVDHGIQEGSNLIDKEGEISFVSSGSIEVHPG